MENKYFNAFLNLLPKGHIWEYPEPLYVALAKTFQRVENWLLLMLLEINPATTISLLARWEHILELPDECSKKAITMQGRKKSVIAKLSYLGEQNAKFYVNLAHGLGYEIEIIEYKPFIAGISRCGTQQLWKDGHEVRYVWKYSIKNNALNHTYFRCGASQCGEKLLTIDAERELDCRIQKAAQAHTIPIPEYEITTNEVNSNEI